MDLNKLKIAKSQALHFMNTVRNVESRAKEKNGIEDVSFGTKETAACKRASMDLTRALAELRRPY